MLRVSTGLPIRSNGRELAGLVRCPEDLMTRPQQEQGKKERDGERAERSLFRWEESARVYLEERQRDRVSPRLYSRTLMCLG